jgi:hypothetical protein
MSRVQRSSASVILVKEYLIQRRYVSGLDVGRCASWIRSLVTSSAWLRCVTSREAVVSTSFGTVEMWRAVL